MDEITPIQCVAAPRLGDKWHLDEAVVTINGERHFLWRAVDQDGFVLEVLVQKRRDTKAAKRFIRKLLSGQGAVPRVMVTDKLGSYGAANRAIGLTVCDHRQHKGLNNRVENSHRPIRRQERGMKRFKSTRHLQCFASIHDPIYNLHHFPHDRFTSAIHRELRQTANTIWRGIAGL
ncbi:putative transposase [Ochrobactrum intermedium]|uniref:Transposase n=1 Tax=Brucella intermedia TaxID=94625 RepID=A0ABR6AUV3_9HYPH|nr:putative transposase [Brucella intermedia]